MKRPAKETLVELAEYLLDQDVVATSKAFLDPTREPKMWVFDGMLWTPDTGADSQFNSFMRRMLCREYDAPRVDKRLVGDFVDTLRSMMLGTRPVRELSSSDFEKMRKRARKMLFLRGGALDLSGDAPVLHQWGHGSSESPRAALFFADEIIDIDCPASVSDFGGYMDLLRVFKVAFPQHWPVVLEMILKTLRAEQQKITLVLYGPRDALKTAVFATFIRQALTNVHCPVKVDPFMVSQRWCNKAETSPDKITAMRNYGRSLFRVVDDADKQTEKAKFSIHLTTIRKQQGGADTFAPPGNWKRTVATRTLPLFVVTTNHPVEELFTEIPRELDQRARILVVDTHGSALDADGPAYDAEVAASVKTACIDCDNNPAKYSRQLMSLLCWWMSDPPERNNVGTLIDECRLDAYLTRRDAARAAGNGTSSSDERLDALIEFLGSPEDDDNYRFVRVEGRGGVLRKKIYEAAGVDFTKGGKPSVDAGNIVEDWMDRKFGVVGSPLSGGAVGYKGIALSR